MTWLVQIDKTSASSRIFRVVEVKDNPVLTHWCDIFSSDIRQDEIRLRPKLSEGTATCSSSGFPCVGVRLVYSSLRCTATFVIRFHWSLLLAFSLHFSSSSAFLRSLFTQSSHLSCGLPRFLQPSCFIVSDLFGNFSSFILTMCPAHFIRLLTILPTMQALVRGHSMSNHQIFGHFSTDLLRFF